MDLKNRHIEIQAKNHWNYMGIKFYQIPMTAGIAVYSNPVVTRYVFASLRCTSRAGQAVVEGSFGRRVEIHLHVGFDFTIVCPYFTLHYLFVL
jgi:hypothetical protein